MSERVLAVDTTSEFGSLALAADGAIVEEILLHSPQGFGHVLFPQMEALLARHGWSLASIDAFAAAAGPGSFTGVRIGLAAVKGLAETLGKRAAAVGNLKAIAESGSGALRAALFDARRGQVYGAVYRADLTLAQAETVARLGDWLANLPAGELEFVTPQPEVFAAALPGPVIRAPRALAAAVARLARIQGFKDPAALDANYVRRSDAELLWTDRP